MRKIKIVYLLDNLDLGGSQGQCVETAAGIDRQSFDAKLYCLFKGGPLKHSAEKQHLDITVFHIIREHSSGKTRIHFWKLRALFALYQYLRREQPDIVHCYMTIPSLYGGCIAKLAHVRTLIASQRNLDTRLKTHIDRFFEKIAARIADKMIVNSQSVRQIAMERNKISISKIHLLYNGVDTQHYRLPEELSKDQIRQMICQKYGLNVPNDVPVIGMLANLLWHKGYRDFILAASEVRQVYPDIQFLCIGEDLGIRHDLEQLIEQQGLRRYILFTGQVQDSSEILPLLDIQVSASHEEGFSNAILEGMAMAKPLIATAVGGTPEAIIHNKTGLLVPPHNPTALAQAIVFLLNNAEIAQQLGEHARKHVEQNFSKQQMLENLKTLYLQLYTQHHKVTDIS